jgi:pimeloyl-ACP methyl ester carboxylesterase
LRILRLMSGAGNVLPRAPADGRDAVEAPAVSGGHLVALDGIRLSYRVVGEGTPVVLLHALTVDSAQNWEQPGIVEALVAQGWQAVLVDARGHGASDLPDDPGSYGWARHGHDVTSLLDHLQIERCVLVGYSLGAGTAAWVTSREGRVAAAVLAGVSEQTISQWTQELLDGHLQGLQAQHAAAGADADDARLAAMVASVRALTEPNDFRLSMIRVPVLVLNGVEDAPPGELADSIPNAVQRTVPGNHGTAPLFPEFTKELLAFLDDLRTRGLFTSAR